MAQPERLQKIISAAGVASRRKAEEMISAGRVKVNGRSAKIGDSAGKNDIITIDGTELPKAGEKLYIAIYKPRGVVTTMEDERGRKCVASLVSQLPQRVYPVGRLDKDSEGLLLMTNDGDFSNMVMHPKGHVPKTYRVTVKPGVTEEQLIKFQTGVVIDGRMTAPAKVRVITEESERAVLEVILFEGRNREIRKICESMGIEVARLKRTAIGPVKLGMLRQSQIRELTEEEKKSLIAAAGKGESKGRMTGDDNNTSGRGQAGGRKNPSKSRNRR